MSGGPIVEPALVRGARTISCPNCGGTVELRGFAHTRTASCIQCLSVIDVSSPELQILSRFDEKMRQRPVIPIGTRGHFGGVAYELIGFQVRTQWEDGVAYSWHEYLLFNPYHGFRYLTLYNGHWNLVRNLAGVPVLSMQGTRRVATTGGVTYQHFQAGVAQTTFVMGEFPWAIEAGEKVQYDDLVAPPGILSREANGNEFTWSIGEYMDGTAVWQAFSMQGAPPAVYGIAPNQPSPYPARVRGMWLDFAKLVFVWGALLAAFLFFSHHDTLLSTHASIDMPQDATPAAITTSSTFQIKEPVDILKIEVRGPEEMGPLSVALVDVAQQRTCALEFDEQDGRTDIFRAASLPAGTYAVHLQPERSASPTAPTQMDVDIKVKRDSGGIGWIGLSLLFLLIPPIVMWLRASTFESRRWSQSSSAASNAGDDDE